ncbi:unnamed protein product [Rotaria sordida]|uniref:Uncharacterized protein n=1 Tax=Rotaria sordida TaxID=392033 RepID=A0A818TC20_9BILA|nr:unnamed protein product [Rotaria sordida]
MHRQVESQYYHYTPRIYVHKRPLHWFIMFISYLFIFLLILESIAFIVLGAWHLSIPRLENILSFSDDIYRRELGFGILLVIIGSIGILISIIGIIATITLRLLLLRIYVSCLWFMMILGIVIGIIGIIFASQVDGFLNDDRVNNPNLVESNYHKEKFLLGMNGGLALFMSLTMLVGIIIVHCLIGDANSHSRTRSFNDDYIVKHNDTPCSENRICHQKKNVSTNQKMKPNDLALCPYEDLFVPIPMLNLKDKLMKAECEDLHSKCPTFVQYYPIKFIGIDGRSVAELCPYTCSQCPHLSSPLITTTTVNLKIFQDNTN